jgi:hypothetical protein
MLGSEDIICGGKFIGDMDKYELRDILLEKVREVKICYKVMTAEQARRVLALAVGETKTERLERVLADLSVAADTAELLLREEHPGEAASLRDKVSAARLALGLGP